MHGLHHDVVEVLNAEGVVPLEGVVSSICLDLLPHRGHDVDPELSKAEMDNPQEQALTDSLVLVVFLQPA